MTKVNDVVSNLPISVLGEIVIDNNKLHIPGDLERDEIMTKLSSSLGDIGLSDEKALYLACTVDHKPLPSLNEVLRSFRIR